MVRCVGSSRIACVQPNLTGQKTCGSVTPIQMATDDLPNGIEPCIGQHVPSTLLEDYGRVLCGQACQETRVRIAAELDDVRSPLRKLLGNLEDVDSALWKDT